ncbi:FAS1 domain-containing protein SELMODRAFT_448915-like [Gastrolobium bilobum]|uniref:FAS1 domain-containing protein SELMODRAFT_448915-like n=1 Tax=Gastrolobium bilobum TaxID=150636 RepID=UPI002AB1AA2F|nr:FAS1 domain-containing protein SELMODRAFT_448915-like [Gastrolobium bilobum]
MASNVFLVVSFLLLMSISSVTPTGTYARNQDLLTATEEMQKANYFTFVMLINMSPPDTRLQGNVTFLMPKDRMLANMVLQEGSVSSFLLRHSIPSPLLFDTLEQFPTGTTIPSSLPNCMLRITNNGRKNFVLNNVKIISPNLCVAGSSIRCHGIDGVLSEACISINNSSVPSVPSVPLPPCLNSTEPSCKASPPIPSPSLPSAPPNRDNPSPPPTVTAPSPTAPKSGSPHLFSYDGSFHFVTCLMFSLIGYYKKSDMGFDSDPGKKETEEKIQRI